MGKLLEVRWARAYLLYASWIVLYMTLATLQSMPAPPIPHVVVNAVGIGIIASGALLVQPQFSLVRAVTTAAVMWPVALVLSRAHMLAFTRFSSASPFGLQTRIGLLAVLVLMCGAIAAAVTVRGHKYSMPSFAAVAVVVLLPVLGILMELAAGSSLRDALRWLGMTGLSLLLNVLLSLVALWVGSLASGFMPPRLPLSGRRQQGATGAIEQADRAD